MIDIFVELTGEMCYNIHKGGNLIMETNFADVRCPSCGAPAKFDIISQQYLCGFCGGKVGIREAIAQKQGFRELHQRQIKESAEKYRLFRGTCTGCGAEIVFPEGEAMSNCAFCGRTLVRKNYIASKELPELIIPFRITEEEAKSQLEKWCAMNSGKREARHIREHIGELTGFYLPYELVRGPVSCKVSRMDGGKSYICSGFVDNVFVSCSKQLDNMLLDGMEPFELDDLKEFDFAYAAGQRIKTADVKDKALISRVNAEVSADYAPTVRRTLETKAVDVYAYSDNALRMPALMPVYYISSGETMAAVNGQTGKVSVRAEKVSHYYFTPWWLKAILSTLLISGISYAAFRFFGMTPGESVYLTGLLALVWAIITLCAYSDTVHNHFRVESERKIYSSRGGPFRRTDSGLTQDAKEIRKQVTRPVFYEKIEGVMKPVLLKFTSPLRIVHTAGLSLFVLFLPVILALFINGFDFGRLELGGSAVWFCIFVPVIPVYILKFARIELYERPWIYLLNPDGSRKKYRKKGDIKITGDTVTTVLGATFLPPGCLAVWFAILSFITMVYLTAFGFD